MTMKLELTPELQAGLLAQARQNGLSLEAYAEQVLRERVTAPSAPALPPVADRRRAHP
jgi:predicted HicB family RNase H-like nuclease